MRRVGRIGATEITACVVVFACTHSTAALVPRVCPSRFGRPCGGAAELVRPARLLASLFSLVPTQPLHSFRGSVPQGSGDHAAGRRNWCDRRNCLRRCCRLDQLNRRPRSEGLSLKAPATVRRGGRIGATEITACIVAVACTHSTAALVPRVCPSRVWRPCGGAAELVRPR
jgi:hypothetical protein